MTAYKEAPDSKFAYVVVAARRARQLMMGGRPLVPNPHSHKNTRIAEEELIKGLLDYDMVLPGETDEKDAKKRKG
jgi:DNA-directed RNA polymerase omega subunit